MLHLVWDGGSRYFYHFGTDVMGMGMLPADDSNGRLPLVGCCQKHRDATYCFDGQNNRY
jgi:hypothetical protein